MRNNLPNISDAHKVCIVCEGNEEYAYLNRLMSLGVWNQIYDFYLDNASGNGNIPARYQDRYQNGAYEIVLIFCDTEKKPYKQYEDIKRKINEFHGVDGAADEVILFANPCTMQIVIKHWGNDTLKTAAKPINAPLIEKYTGVKDYKGKATQIEDVVKCISSENYADMCQRVKCLDVNDTVIGNSNFYKFVTHFESGNADWIDEINARLD